MVIMKRAWRVFSAALFFLFCLSGVAFSAEKVFTKEFTYSAANIDDESTARVVALTQAKRLVLEKFGAYIGTGKAVKGFTMKREMAAPLLPGAVRVEILDEKWQNGKYYLKAVVKADAYKIARALVRLANDDNKSAELNDARRRADETLKGMELLKDRFDAGQTGDATRLDYAKKAKGLEAIDRYEGCLFFGNSGDNDRAIEACSKAIELDPDYVEAYKNRGVAYDNKAQYAKAIEDYDRALSLRPDYAEVYNDRGAAYARQRKYDKAVEDYGAAIKFRPDMAVVYNNRANAYDDMGQYEKAMADYDKAVALQPNYADAYYNRGLAFDRKREYEKAIDDYNRAIKLKPDYATVYNSRGIIYAKTGQYDRALADFDKAVKIQPDYGDAYYNRGLVYFAKGKRDKAVNDYKKSCDLGSKLGCEKVKAGK